MKSKITIVLFCLAIAVSANAQERLTTFEQSLMNEDFSSLSTDNLLEIRRIFHHRKTLLNEKAHEMAPLEPKLENQIRMMKLQAEKFVTDRLGADPTLAPIKFDGEFYDLSSKRQEIIGQQVGNNFKILDQMRANGSYKKIAEAKDAEFQVEWLQVCLDVEFEKENDILVRPFTSKAFRRLRCPNEDYGALESHLARTKEWQARAEQALNKTAATPPAPYQHLLSQMHEFNDIKNDLDQVNSVLGEINRALKVDKTKKSRSNFFQASTR